MTTEPALDRRKVLTLGGGAVLLAAVFAACGDDDDSNGAAAASGETTTTQPTASAKDIATLRTATSVENAAVAAYKRIVDAGLVKAAQPLSAVQRMQANHQDHAQLFQNTTTGSGGQ